MRWQRLWSAAAALYGRKWPWNYARKRTGSLVSTVRIEVCRLNQSERHSSTQVAPLPIPRRHKQASRFHIPPRCEFQYQHDTGAGGSRHDSRRANDGRHCGAGTRTKDRSNHAETLLRSDAEKTAPATPGNTDLLVAILMARPEIKSVSDLTSKTIAIDDKHSASVRVVRTAIVAAGASEVELIGSRTKAINVLISGAVPAAVLALVSPEAAEGFPAIAGFKIFRIPLSPGSSKPPL